VNVRWILRTVASVSALTSFGVLLQYELIVSEYKQQQRKQKGNVFGKEHA